MSGVHEAMAEVISAVAAIAKEGSENVSYKFRSIDATLNALHGPLSANGLFLAPEVLDDWQLNAIPGTNNRTQYQAVFRVQIHVWHKSGESVTLGPGLAQSHDYGDKAVYQAQQNAIKYLLLEAFAIPTAEEDMDAREADLSPTASEADLAWGWVWNESKVFKAWSDTRRLDAAERAQAALEIKRVSNMAEAHKVLERMREIYEAEGDQLLSKNAETAE